MGVNKLWTLLEPAKRIVDLSSLEGQKVAVDLSGWICQFLKVQTSCPKGYIYTRNLFFRVCTLLRAGIQPVFVLDGKAPDIKAEEIERRHQLNCGEAQPFNSSRPHLQSLQLRCCELLEAMGLPCVQSEGEAESLCAILNSVGIVDACITDDGDALLYGAKQIYKTYSREDQTFDGFSIDDIVERTGLCRRSLIAIAVLSGCDYDKSGVDGVGALNAAKLAGYWRSKGEDPLTRLQSWRNDDNLSSIQKLLNSPRKKPVHCKNCYHLGNSRSHSLSGCELCSTDVECIHIENDEFSCTCAWHKDEKIIKDNKLELRLREKALTNSNFPNIKIIEEYTNTNQDVSDIDIKWTLPNVKKIHEAFRAGFSNWELTNVTDHIIPVFVYLHLYSINLSDCDISSIKPHRIVKLRQKDKKDCVEVEWNKLETDSWTPHAFYTVIVEKELFKRKYSDMLKKYEDEIEAQKQEKKLKTNKKRKSDDQQTKKRKPDDQQTKKRKPDDQQTMTNFFTVIKKKPNRNVKMSVASEGIEIN